MAIKFLDQVIVVGQLSAEIIGKLENYKLLRNAKNY